VPIHIPLHLYKPAPDSFLSLIPFLQPLATVQLSFSRNGFFVFLCFLHHFLRVRVHPRSHSRIRPIAAYEACAPLHWDAEEWDFQTWSEDDESLTDGEDLHLLGGELDEDDEDDTSLEEDFFSSEEEADSSSTEDSVAGGYLLGGSSKDDDDYDDDEEAEDSSDFSSDSGGDDGGNDNSSNDDSDASMAPPSKHRRVSSTYWW
jgi:hypothetical protein